MKLKLIWISMLGVKGEQKVIEFFSGRFRINNSES
jgi:hypothetical protein